MDEALKRRRRRRLMAYAAGGALIVGGAATTIGPLAPLVVDHLGDGARVWRLGHIRIDGVSGSWFGDLRAEHITIEDDSGVWFDARHVALEWRPQDILFGSVHIDAARANSVVISRRPELAPDRPDTGASLDIVIDTLAIETLTLEQAVVGEAAQFRAELALHLHDEALLNLAAEIRRLDSDADRLIAVYRPQQDYALNIDLESAPGGVIARMLDVEEQGVRATATGDGDLETGQARYAAYVGDAEVLQGSTQWANARWSAAAQGRLDLLPGLQSLAERIGPRVSIQATGERAGAFQVHAETPFLALDASGALDERRELDGPAQIVATTSRLSDIAHESPFSLGPARLEGELRRARGTTAIRGTLDARGVEAFGRNVRLVGPVEASLSESRFDLTGDLRADAEAPALFANARLRTTLGYDRQRGRFSLDSASLEGDAVDFDAQGWVNDENGEFSGEWRVRRLQAFEPGLSGEAGGRWRAFAEQGERERIWTIAVDGQGARIAGEPAIVPQLLGATPRLDARLAYERGGITVSHARIDGARLRAGATGRIVDGEANLALEASARGPLNIGGAEIAGAVDATGRLTGRIARPALSAQASLSSFTAGGVVVEQPTIDFTMGPSGESYVGRASVQGAARGQALNGSANVAINNGGIALTNLDGQWGALQAQGAATFASRGVSATLDVNGALDGLIAGMTGRFAGDVALTPETVLIDAQIMDARAGDLRVRAATLHAEGPFNAIAARFDMRGRLRRAPLAFEGTALIDAGDVTTARIDGRGTLSDAPIFTRAPMIATWRERGLEATANVEVGDGFVRVQWTDRGRSLNGTAQIDDAPLAPLAAIWGERASGRIDGQITLANNGGGLAGNADVTLNDARFAGRQRGTLDMRIVGDLDPSRLQATVDATSTEGLVAHFEANAPVVTSTAPIRIALAPDRRGRATWSVRGPAASLWAAARLPDQSLEGQLDGQGELEFGAGYLSGDGYFEIAGGRFEDKLTGVTLVDLDARVALDQRGVTIETFTASAPGGGRLTATGGSATARQGRIAVNIAEMRVANRPDARARASGDLTLEWEGLRSSLTGTLNIIEADLDIAANPEAGIPTLDVIEINRPGEEDWPEDEAPPLRSNATVLDVRVRAPGRVFTRGRGIDAEWALDMRLQGTAGNPQIFGEATAVRGTVSLSGQPFEVEEARIRFTGDPLDARIDLTAVRDTADLTARVRLTGTARRPEITFTSDPPLPEDEILPQILFGASVEDLSPLEAAQLAASLAALSGRAGLDLVDAARAAAGLDRFNVRQDEAGGFLVAGGVYLTRDVYLEVARTGLGQAQTRVEWTIRPRLVLITSFLGNGDQRVSLRWRRESD